MKKDLPGKIKELRSICPSQEWRESHKDLLMTQIRSQVIEARQKGLWYSFVAQKLALFKSFNTYKMLFKQSGIIAMIAMLILGSGVYGVYAAEQSLPGELLYNVKRTKERVRVSFSTSDEKRAQLHIEFAGRRIEEINTLKAQPIDTSKKVKSITVAVTNYKEEIAEAKNKLYKAEHTVKEPAKIIEVANLLDDKVEEYGDYLDKNVKNATEVKTASTASPQVAEEVNDAIKVSKEVAHDAVTVLIKQSSKDGIEADVKEKVKTKVLKKIERTQADVDEAAENLLEDIVKKDKSNILPEEEQIETAEDAQLIDNKNTLNETSAPTENQVVEKIENEEPDTTSISEANPDNVDTLDGVQPNPNEAKVVEGSSAVMEKSLKPETVIEVQKVITEEPKKVENLLNEAQQLVAEGNLSGALEKVQASQSLVEEIKVRVQDIVKQDEEDQIADEKMLNEKVSGEESPIEVPLKTTETADQESEVSSDSNASTDSIHSSEIKTEITVESVP